MMPLCTMATRAEACGWALRSVGAPCVAQRVWPMPVKPASGFSFSSCAELDELAGRAAALDVAVDQRGDAGGIIAAIFEPLQRFQDEGRYVARSRNADDAAHYLARPSSSRFVRAHGWSRAQPGFVRPGAPRPTASASGATSSVITEPAADIGAVADLDRRHQRGVRADEGARADLGAVLVRSRRNCR